MTGYQQRVDQWPEELRQVLDLETEALRSRHGLGLDEARLMAYTRMVMGRVRLPPLRVRLDRKGRASVPLEGLPASIEWLEPQSEPTVFEEARLAAG
jgi:hypothetical protein